MRYDLSLFTSDGERIAASHYRNGKDRLVLVSHGFFNSRNSRTLQRAIGFLVPRYDVITFDYRGHGESSGSYTFSAREGRDLEAVFAYIRRFAYRKKALLGFSLGAYVPVSSPGSRQFFDSMMLVSCPWSFISIDCHFWEKPVLVSFRDMFNENAKGRGARIGNPFLKKPFASEAMPHIKAPVLFVHGQKDWLVKPWHSRALFNLKGRPGRLEILRDGFHAEKLADQFPGRFSQLSLEWFRETLS